MTNAPTFRVFLNNHKSLKDLNKLFPEGIPCDRIIAPLDELLTHENSSFRVDLAKCNDAQLTFLKQLVSTQHNLSFQNNPNEKIAISFEDVDYVINFFGEKLTFSDFSLSHAVTVNVQKQSEITFKFNGLTTHVLIKTLQTNLENPLIQNSEFFKELMELIALMIIQITDNDENLKRHYLAGFPKEFIIQASFLLFPE